MSRVYATDDNGERFLRYLECDRCGARIKPHPDIANSGWTKHGIDDPKRGGRFEWAYCPECS